jgi:hypothetical protein
MNLHETIHSTFERLKKDRTFNDEGLIEYALARNLEVPIQLEKGTIVDFDASWQAIMGKGAKVPEPKQFAKCFNQWQAGFVSNPSIFVYYKDDSYEEVIGYMFSSGCINTELQPTTEGFGKILYYFTPKGRNEWLMCCANIEARQQHGYLSWISNKEFKEFSSGGEFYITTSDCCVYQLPSNLYLGKFSELLEAKEFCEFIRSR